MIQQNIAVRPDSDEGRIKDRFLFNEKIIGYKPGSIFMEVNEIYKHELKDFTHVHTFKLIDVRKNDIGGNDYVLVDNDLHP